MLSMALLAMFRVSRRSLITPSETRRPAFFNRCHFSGLLQVYSGRDELHCQHGGRFWRYGQQTRAGWEVGGVYLCLAHIVSITGIYHASQKCRDRAVNRVFARQTEACVSRMKRATYQAWCLGFRRQTIRAIGSLGRTG